jgi:anti-anti-sigma regulatory factor
MSGPVTVIHASPASIEWLRNLVDPRRDHSGQVFHDELTALMDAAPGPVVLDLGGAPFVNSEGVASLIRMHQRMHAKGVRFGVRGGGEVVRLFELTQLAKLFPCGGDLPTVITQVSTTGG